MKQNDIKQHSFFLNWPRILGHFLKLSSKLVRLRVFDYECRQKFVDPVIFAHWHSEDLSMLPHFGHMKACILVSPSKDGSMLSEAVSTLGYSTCRGSSSRGGAAGLIALKNVLLKEKSNIIIAADGPRGPRNVAKPGALYLAAKSGCPIIPCGSAGSREFIFKKSWNRTRFQLPFSKLVVVGGKPLYFPPEAVNWPKMEQSRIVTAAISDALREAQLRLQQWQEEK